MTADDPMAWRSELEPAERTNLTSELSCALLGYWHNDPADDVLNRVATVLAEWQQLAATPDRLRPSDTVTLADFRSSEDRVLGALLAQVEAVVPVDTDRLAVKRSEFLAALSGGDLPADAVAEERCLKPPIGCGEPLIDEDGSTRVFWDADEAARYKAEWEITGLCPNCQDSLDGGEGDE